MSSMAKSGLDPDLDHAVHQRPLKWAEHVQADSISCGFKDGTVKGNVSLDETFCIIRGSFVSESA
jgi:hypothetical protein